MSFKIYTKTGDKGETSLYGGKRVKKTHARIEAYGTIDELNSHIGLLLGMLAQNEAFANEELTPHDQQLIMTAAKDLLQVQNQLFNVGSVLATPEEKKDTVKPISSTLTDLLEVHMDEMDKVLEPLSSFILPGGSSLIGQAHVCRTVCRRAERRVVELQQQVEIDRVLLQFLNRLSDYFFILSRYIARVEGVEDVKWEQ